MDAVGYDEEISMLENLFASESPEFLALYGRKHADKPSLIRQFFLKKEVTFFNVTGLKEGSQKDQLAHFNEEMGKAFF